jgi:hypothetical protein
MAKFSAYPPLDGLVDLACRDGVDIRPTLLRVLTDLYVQKPTHSADEETQYAELALGLLEAVDAPTRAAVLASLSAYPAAPAAILRKLTDTASDRGGGDASRCKAETHDLVELFFTAGAEERHLILANLDVAVEAVSIGASPASSEVIRRLETAALQRNIGEFSRTLERALGISRALAERIANDRSGEPIVVAAKALGMPSAVLQRILLFLDPAIGQSVERVYDLSRLFEELVPAAAARMATIWRTASKPSRPVYAPAYWDDERRSARSLSTPAPRRDLQRRAGQRSWLKTGEQK